MALGLTATKFWTRKRFKGTDELKRHINPTRIPIATKESMRWLDNLKQSTELLMDSKRCIHVGDRESDIFELFCLAQEQETFFLFRTCVDRVTGEGNELVSDALKRTPCKGSYSLRVENKERKSRIAKLAIKYAQVLVQPPSYKKLFCSALHLTVLEAKEDCQSKKMIESPIHWKLITNLLVTSLRSAVEKLRWYAMRWKIETFHKILKSGLKIEDSRLRTAQRLTNLIALCTIVAWRILWITTINRVIPQEDAHIALTEAEIKTLEKIFKSTLKDVSSCIIHIAKLGGYLARSHDPPPGITVIWRGFSRLHDIQFGFNAATN